MVFLENRYFFMAKLFLKNGEKEKINTIQE